MATLDAELELLLVRKEIFDKDPSVARLEVLPDELIPVSIVFSGDITALEKAGLQVGSASARVAYGATTLVGLQALAALPQVKSIERQRHPHPHLNDSVPDIKANQVWGLSGDNFNGYTGRGVIVGVIDSGIDITHPNFQKSDGTSRVVAIWDQTLTKTGPEQAPAAITDPKITLGGTTPLGYGVEYNQKQINDTVNNNSNPVKVRHIDEDGHGTHVAGIAAGNGSKRGGCLIKYQYVGVAPEADIIMVRLFGLTKSDHKLPAPSSGTNGYLLDAIRYILNVANTLAAQNNNSKQAAVINLSLGRFSEFMDGTSAKCQDIDALLNANSTGRAIVFSAGNDGAANFHASGTVPAGSATSLALTFTIYDDDTAKRSRTLMVMYSGSNLQAQITSPVAGAAGVVAWVSSGANGSSTTANGPNGMVTIQNKPNRITISISSTQASAGPPPTYNALTAGTWKLELRDTTNTATTIDAYCLYGSSNEPKSPRFLSNTTSRSTLCETATCHEALAVGSCKVVGALSEGALSDFSARGPTLDAPGRTKPELCAPGHNVTSAHSSKIVDDPDCFICCCSCCEAYVDKPGTSMAAPHIAGVIALMLHKDPNLTHVDITKALTANAAPKPSDSTPADDLGWGAGRTDAEATITSATIIAVNPPVLAQAADTSIVPEALAQLDPVLAVRDELLATERGAEFSQLFEEHATEIWRLINTNRRVATVWHRCKGPVWVRLSLRAVHAPKLPVPMKVDDLTLRQAIDRFARIVRRYASAPLRRDLQTYLPQLSILTDGMNLSDLIEAVGRRPAPAGADQLPAPA
jgi:subtilisin family serine protease